MFPPARLEALQAGLKTGLDTAVILQPVAELLPTPALASSPAPGPPPAPQLVRERMAEISAALDTPDQDQVEVQKQAVEVQHSVEMEMQTERKLIEANGSGSLSAENEDVAAIAKALEECQVAEKVERTYTEEEREEDESKCVEEQNEKASNLVAED